MLQKLQILAFSDDTLKSKVGEYKVQINPETYAHSFNSTFSEDKGIETASVIAKFKTRMPEKISLEFHIDATGVIPGVTSVTDEITSFKAVAYNFNGAIHSPNYLKLLWGDLTFNCMLDSLDIDYTLFSPSGAPLRAKLALKLRQHQTPEELARRSAKQSADLTHARTVSAGETLPLMCYRIYDDSRYYASAARLNDLDDLMHLRTGMSLVFPPIKG